ncbi:hypothetical protein ACLOJK_025467 [Asimina triloba]
MDSAKANRTRLYAPNLTTARSSPPSIASTPFPFLPLPCPHSSRLHLLPSPPLPSPFPFPCPYPCPTLHLLSSVTSTDLSGKRMRWRDRSNNRLVLLFLFSIRSFLFPLNFTSSSTHLILLTAMKADFGDPFAAGYPERAG